MINGWKKEVLTELKKNIFKTEYVPKKSRWHIFENILYLVVLMIFIKVMLFNFMYVSAKVDGKSMQPNLNPPIVGETERDNNEQDIVFVNKFASFTYGDIVVIGGARPLIKRVIAFGGDEVRYELDNNTNAYMLYLNDEKLIEEYEVIDLTIDNIRHVGGPFAELQELESEKHNIKDVDGDGIYETYVVPEGKVFVMGDNRPNSTDSRTYGAFKYDDIKGTVSKVIPYGTSKLTYFFYVLFI